MLALNAAAGCVIIADADVVHPLLSVIDTVYVPDANPLAIEVACTGDVFHK